MVHEHMQAKVCTHRLAGADTVSDSSGLQANQGGTHAGPASTADVCRKVRRPQLGTGRSSVKSRACGTTECCN